MTLLALKDHEVNFCACKLVCGRIGGLRRVLHGRSYAIRLVKAEKKPQATYK
jgi:hypothetical protein